MLKPFFIYQLIVLSSELLTVTPKNEQHSDILLTSMATICPFVIC